MTERTRAELEAEVNLRIIADDVSRCADALRILVWAVAIWSIVGIALVWKAWA